ncbi:MAG: shikimate dehydrogenase family protein [Thermoguttaceae bacterium]
MLTLPESAKEKTIYFIGVSTESSSIMQVFPRWSAALELGAVIRGIDIGIHAPADDYRAVLEFIKNDPNSCGALVTTHKLDIVSAGKDLFDSLDPYAELLGEVSSISKRNGSLWGHAKDPISSGLSAESFLPKKWWKNYHDAQVLLLGAGGSSLATSIYFMDPKHGDNRPSKIIITNRSQPRLDHAKHIHEQLDCGVEVEYHLCTKPEENDAVLGQLPKFSLVVNATGLGKDVPGSPITDSVIFPEQGFAWEFNYRGDLKFLHQALRQRDRQNLMVEDGWNYFIYGWSEVIAEVFHLDLNTEMVKKLKESVSDLQPHF